MSVTIGARLARYEILSLLGAGGMGEVYRAKDTRLDREVAIKVLADRYAEDQDVLARFHREGKAVAALSHANIRAIYDISTEQGTTFAVMELLEGDTLAARIRRAPLDWREAVEIGLAAASGLAAAHAKGIVHRDIKPANIFLDASGGVKILDFGLARLKSSEAAGGQLATATRWETQPGVVMGTVDYMSPEQVRGQQADARSDIFSFGCVLFEMLTGRRPFTGESSADVIAAILHDPPPALSASGKQRPAELDRLIARCLQKDAAARFASGRELAQALKTVGHRPDAAETSAWSVAETSRTSQPELKPAPAASIAVLPFVNMSPDKDNEYFSDGLAEELISALTKVEGLHVAPRTSAFAFKGKNEDIRKIGEQLNVLTVLEGSVRKAGDRLRISAQLVNVADSRHLWSETYNRQLEDIFAIQDEIAQNIVKALRVVLTEKERRALERVPTADVRAYEYYLRGMQYFHQMRRKSLEFARQMFARAIEIDPAYALAYAGQAHACALLHTWWDASDANLKDADQASHKAIELEPDLAEAHLARGMALSVSKQYEQARQEFEIAISQNPSLFEAYYFYGRTWFAQGQFAEAARLFEHARRVRPEDYQAPLYLALAQLGGGRQADALASYRCAMDAIETHLGLHPDDGRALYMGACALSQLGEGVRAQDWAKRALAMDPEEPVTLYAVACAYAPLGLIDEAIECLERAVKYGIRHKQWIEHDPDLEPLRTHPRFQALLQRL